MCSPDAVPSPRTVSCLACSKPLVCRYFCRVDFRLLLARYRRAEQPLRIRVWYWTNDLCSHTGSAISTYILVDLSPPFSPASQNPKLRVYQVIFLFCGLVLSNSISEARFLLLETRKTVVERVRLGVRANNTGNKPTSEPTWRQAPVAPIEPKTSYSSP
ncbi:hypothetical protein B0H10DRAFT_2184464 [Mycena sp. CBHHK59/15]|nr:hypothetical protein B0H10DRAFT_2184464 [Mycena sp. CBHHK59/15]